MTHLARFVVPVLMAAALGASAAANGPARGRCRNPEARAHLDVHDPEPFDNAYPLLGLPNATLSPHQASRTETAMRDMSWVVRDVVAVLEGRPPVDRAPAVDVSG